MENEPEAPDLTLAGISQLILIVESSIKDESETEILGEKLCKLELLGCVKVPKVKNSIFSRAFPIPFDPSNMRNLQKFPSEIV